MTEPREKILSKSPHPIQYVRGIVASRFFWLHLARAEVRSRFRRSKLGLLWALLQPLLLTLLMAFVFGAIFHLPMGSFAPFVFSGILVWDFVFGAAIIGCSSLILATPYICQRRLPLAIYPLKTILSTFVSFSVGLIGLGLWVLVTNPRTYGLCHMSLLVSLPLLATIAWALAMISAFTNARFRDYQYLIGLVLQGLWYVSPVFLEPKLFKAAGIEFLLQYNPITHVLNLIRAPFLSGSLPTLGDYLYSAGLSIALWLFAAYRVHRQENDLVYYL